MWITLANSVIYVCAYLMHRSAEASVNEFKRSWDLPDAVSAVASRLESEPSDPTDDPEDTSWLDNEPSMFSKKT